MKVLHTLSQLPQKTGSGVYFFNLLKQFRKRDLENVVLYGTEAPFEIFFDDVTNYKMEFKTEELPFPIPGMSDEMPYESTVYSKMTSGEIDLFREKYREKLIKIKEKENPDVIISHHLFILTDLVREVFKDKKVIGICHGTDLRQINKHPEFMEYLKNIKNLDKFLTVSFNEIKEISEMFSVDKSKIIRIGGGYDPEIFNYDNLKQKNTEKPIIFYAGKISESKGVFELASSLQIINKKYPKAELHIVGNFLNKEKERLLKNSAYSDNLKLYDAENQLEMALNLKSADIFVLPSYYEALGLSAIEALACGKLVVASEIEGLRTQLGDKVNNSDIIEYVEKPRIINLDEAVEEDKKAYVERLASAIKLQISRLEKYKKIPDELILEIEKSSWVKLSEKVFGIIKDMMVL